MKAISSCSSKHWVAERHPVCPLLKSLRLKRVHLLHRGDFIAKWSRLPILRSSWQSQKMSYHDIQDPNVGKVLQRFRNPNIEILTSNGYVCTSRKNNGDNPKPTAASEIRSQDCERVRFTCSNCMIHFANCKLTNFISFCFTVLRSTFARVKSQIDNKEQTMQQSQTQRQQRQCLANIWNLQMTSLFQSIDFMFSIHGTFSVCGLVWLAACFCDIFLPNTSISSIPQEPNTCSP